MLYRWNQRATQMNPLSGLIVILLAHAGDWAGTLAAMRETVRLKPVDSSGHAYLGFVRGGQGRMSEALASLEKALEIEPDLIDAHFYKGWVLAKAGRKAEAAAVYRKSLELMQHEPFFKDFHPTNWYVRTATAAIQQLER